MSNSEDPVFTALRAATDQYSAGLRDLADTTPGLTELARAMARMVRELCPDADGDALIAAAQAANGALAFIRQAGGSLEATGVIGLIILTGRVISEEAA